MLLLVKGHLWDCLDIFWENFSDTSRQIFKLSLINDIVCIATTGSTGPTHSVDLGSSTEDDEELKEAGVESPVTRRLLSI